MVYWPRFGRAAGTSNAHAQQSHQLLLTFYSALYKTKIMYTIPKTKLFFSYLNNKMSPCYNSSAQCTVIIVNRRAASLPMMKPADLRWTFLGSEFAQFCWTTKKNKTYLSCRHQQTTLCLKKTSPTFFIVTWRPITRFW